MTEGEFRDLVESAFPWLVSRGFRARAKRYGDLGNAVLLTDDRRWLGVSWEARDAVILLSWGDVVTPGRFNDDPYRNSRPLGDLMPDQTVHQLEIAGALVGEGAEHYLVGAALRRLSRLLKESQLAL